MGEIPHIVSAPPPQLIKALIVFSEPNNPQALFALVCVYDDNWL